MARPFEGLISAGNSVRNAGRISCDVKKVKICWTVLSARSRISGHDCSTSEDHPPYPCLSYRTDETSIRIKGYERSRRKKETGKGKGVYLSSRLKQPGCSWISSPGSVDPLWEKRRGEEQERILRDSESTVGDLFLPSSVARRILTNKITRRQGTLLPLLSLSSPWLLQTGHGSPTPRTSIIHPIFRT